MYSIKKPRKVNVLPLTYTLFKVLYGKTFNMKKIHLFVLCLTILIILCAGLLTKACIKQLDKFDYLALYGALTVASLTFSLLVAITVENYSKSIRSQYTHRYSSLLLEEARENLSNYYEKRMSSPWYTRIEIIIGILIFILIRFINRDPIFDIISVICFDISLIPSSILRKQILKNTLKSIQPDYEMSL